MKGQIFGFFTLFLIASFAFGIVKSDPVEKAGPGLQRSKTVPPKRSPIFVGDPDKQVVFQGKSPFKSKSFRDTVLMYQLQNELEDFVWYGSEIKNAIEKFDIGHRKFFKNLINALALFFDCYQTDITHIHYGENLIDLSNYKLKQIEVIKPAYEKFISLVPKLKRKFIDALKNLNKDVLLQNVPGELLTDDVIDVNSEIIGSLVTMKRNGVPFYRLIPRTLRASLGVVAGFMQDIIAHPFFFGKLVTKLAITKIEDLFD